MNEFEICLSKRSKWTNNLNDLLQVLFTSLLEDKFFSNLVWGESLQILTKKINMTIYFENLIIRLHIFYVLNIYVKFHSNLMLFTIQSKTYFLCII